MKLPDICLCFPPDTSWHKVNDPKVDYSGNLGAGWSGMSRGSSPTGLCWSLANFVECGPNKPSWSWTQIWIQVRMPAYSLNWTARSSAIPRGQKVSMMQLAHPKVAKPKVGPFRPQDCHGALTIRHGCQTAHWTVSENTPPLTIVFNIFMRNGTYPLIFIGWVYNNNQ